MPDTIHLSTHVKQIMTCILYTLNTCINHTQKNIVPCFCHVCFLYANTISVRYHVCWSWSVFPQCDSYRLPGLCYSTTACFVSPVRLVRCFWLIIKVSSSPFVLNQKSAVLWKSHSIVNVSGSKIMRWSICLEWFDLCSMLPLFSTTDPAVSLHHSDDIWW